MKITTLPFVETREILSHLNAKKFFAKYLPHIKRYEHKMRGYDTNKKPLDFTEAEKKQIIKAVNQFAKEIKQSCDTKRL
jgi:hypothetical protein